MKIGLLLLLFLAVIVILISIKNIKEVYKELASENVKHKKIKVFFLGIFCTFADGI